jgi:hypothetical protein
MNPRQFGERAGMLAAIAKHACTVFIAKTE